MSFLKKTQHKDLMSQVDNLGVGYVFDYDTEYLYTRRWVYDVIDNEERGVSRIYRTPYSIDSEGIVSVDFDEAEIVVEKSEYTVVSKLISKFFGSTKVSHKVIKQFDDKTNTVIEPLWVAYNEVDGHGDTYKNKDAVYQLVDNFEENKDSIQKAINHEHKTECFDIVKSYVIEEECYIGDALIPALQPVVVLKYSDKAFELRKQGKILGPSIGCYSWDAEIVKSLLDELGKKSVEVKRTLAEFDFSEKRHHLSLTTPSAGGPASQKEWFVSLDKSMISKEDKALLEELGEEFTPLEKKLKSESVDKTAPSTSVQKEAQDAGVDNKTVNRGNESDMSEELKQEIADLRKQLKVSEVEKSLGGYALSVEVIKGLTSELVELETYETITKAFDAYEEVVKGLKAELEEVSTKLEKALETSESEESELAKKLSKEEGHDIDKIEEDLTKTQKAVKVYNDSKKQ